MTFRSPPTTSGIVIISGSNFFGADSDFPIVRANPYPSLSLSLPLVQNVVVFASSEDISITKGVSSVTTSGLAIVEFYPGAGAPYIIPIVSSARLFPISAAAFPTTVSGFETTVSGERIYPLLPQYSTIIP